MAEIRYALCSDLHTSFTGKKRTIRSGGKSADHRSGSRVDLGKHVVQLVPPSNREWLWANIYFVQLSPDLLDRWPKQAEKFYVVSQIDGDIKEYLSKRFGKIASRSMGLARGVLGLAMARLSTRPPKSERVGSRVDVNSPKYCVVDVVDGDDVFHVSIKSNLSYALDAVKGGSGGVDDALKRAANRVNGMVRHAIGRDLDAEWATPFPEVRKRKAG